MIRACDDLKQCVVNSRTVVLTPIALPTWDHLAQMAKSAHLSKTDWSFRKGDHAAEYKQRPLDPQYANLAAISLRRPATGR